MSGSRLKKQLWRRWRRWKKALWAGLVCAGLSLCAWLGLLVPETMSELLESASLQPAEAVWASMHLPAEEGGPETAEVYRPQSGDSDDPAYEALKRRILETGLSRSVHLKSHYLGGEEVETLAGSKSPAELVALLEGYRSWNGRIGEDGSLWLERQVDDLAPSFRDNAYFGVDAEGNLTLFKGPPAEEEALKTFFQMDMRSIKSSLPEPMWKELRDGIRVKDAAEYNSVLSTFSDYARDSAEQVSTGTGH